MHGPSARRQWSRALFAMPVVAAFGLGFGVALADLPVPNGPDPVPSGPSAEPSTPTLPHSPTATPTPPPPSPTATPSPTPTPSATATEAVTPEATPTPKREIRRVEDGMPVFDFPWADGESRTWTGGPHGADDKGQICIDCGFDEVPLERRAGLDFGGGGWDVHPMADGVVLYSGELGYGFGNGVVIDHGQSWATIYAHFAKDDALIAAGAEVTRDSVLGHTGCTATAVCVGGDHLHIDLRRGAYLRDDGSVSFGLRVAWDGRQIHGWTFMADEGNYEGTAYRCSATRYADDHASAGFTAGDASPCADTAPGVHAVIRRPKPPAPARTDEAPAATATPSPTPFPRKLGSSMRSYFANLGATVKLETQPGIIYRVRVGVASDR